MGIEALPSGGDDTTEQTFARRISVFLMDLVSAVPESNQKSYDDVNLARVRAQHVASEAAIKAGLIGGAIAIVPGPLGILTIIPSLAKIWQVQRQMVADIAACYGKTSELSPELMLFCLFRHGAATIFKETVIQVGTRLLVRRASLRVMQAIIQKISINVTQRVISQFISRWVPVVGAVAIGAYVFYDTKKVALNAISTFEKEIETEAALKEEENSVAVTEEPKSEPSPPSAASV